MSKPYVFGFVMLIACVAGSLSAQSPRHHLVQVDTPVKLALEAPHSVVVNSTFTVKVKAGVTPGSPDQEIEAIRAMIDYTSQCLELLSVSSGDVCDTPLFPDDSAADGINDDINDGLAWFSQRCFETMTTTQQRIVKLRFRARTITSGCLIDLIPQIENTLSKVSGADYFGQDVTGSLGQATVEITFP